VPTAIAAIGNTISGRSGSMSHAASRQPIIAIVLSNAIGAIGLPDDSLARRNSRRDAAKPSG